MSKELPHQVQRPIRVQNAVANKLVIEKELDFHDLPGLHEILHERSQKGGSLVKIHVNFNENSNGESELFLQVKGSIPITCQRCLGELLVDIDQATRYLIVENDKMTELVKTQNVELLVLTAQESGDSIRNGELDLNNLVSGDIMLGVPFYPKHENIADCDLPEWLYLEDKQSIEKNNTNDKDVQRPFSDLKNLIKH